MWLALAQGIMRRPWIIALVVMTIFMGVQWTQIQYHKGVATGLRADIVEMQGRLGTCRGNVNTLEGGLELCTAEHDGYIGRLDLMGVELQEEKKLVAYWRNEYINYECPYDPCEDEPITPEKGVLNDENNVDAVNRVNDLFKP